MCQSHNLSDLLEARRSYIPVGYSCYSCICRVTVTKVRLRPATISMGIRPTQSHGSKVLSSGGKLVRLARSLQTQPQLAEMRCQIRRPGRCVRGHHVSCSFSIAATYLSSSSAPGRDFSKHLVVAELRRYQKAGRFNVRGSSYLDTLLKVRVPLYQM